MLEVIRQQHLRLFEQRVDEIERVVEEIVEERLFVPVAPGTNSIGNLVLHVAGNLRSLVGSIGGGVPYERDRELEFSEGSLSREEVQARFTDAVGVTRAVLDGIDEGAWRDLPDDPVFEGETRGDHVQRALDHLSYHTGQIVLIGKILSLIPRS